MDGGNYDCTVPVSGGKDSTYQVIRLLEFDYSVLVDRDTGATEEIEEPLYEILKRRAFNRDEWRALKEHSDSLGLAFFATAGFPEEIEFLIGLGCHSIKIASADVNHKTLIRQAAATGVCLQIDTGNANLGEIEAAVDLILGEGNENIIIHHCPSGYPARLEGINLAVAGPSAEHRTSFSSGCGRAQDQDAMVNWDQMLFYICAG